jgi:hypothetical protein
MSSRIRSGRPLSRRRDRRDGVEGKGGLVALRLQSELEQLTGVLVVFDYQDLRHSARVPRPPGVARAF